MNAYDRLIAIENKFHEQIGQVSKEDLPHFIFHKIKAVYNLGNDISETDFIDVVSTFLDHYES